MINIVLIVLFSMIVLYFLYMHIADKVIYYLQLKEYFISSCNVSNFGYLIVISGMIRAGKTIFMHAITHVILLFQNDKLNGYIHDIETKLIEVNFVKLRSEFYSLLQEQEGQAYKVIQDTLVNMFIVDFNGQKTYTHNLDHYYFDGLKYTKRINLLKDWIKYNYHLARQDRVYSNIKSWNQITGTYSKQFKKEYIELKNQFESGEIDFPLDEWSIINHDEQLLDSKNDNDQQRRNEDSGSDIAFRLHGQIFKESTYYISTLQEATRWFKTEREIMQTHPFIRRCQLRYYRPNYFNFLQIRESINDFIYNFFLRNEDYRSKENYFKRKKLKLLQKQEYLISKSFIEFDVNVYSDDERVGKPIKPEDVSIEEYSRTFLMPVCYCWDIGDTHAFYKLFEYLKSRSKTDRDSLYATELNDQDIEEMLKKTKAKLEEKKQVKQNIQDINVDFYK